MKKLGIITLFLFLGIGITLAQTQVVKGSVVDESGDPIIGATVAVKGTTTATMTDVDGKFQLSVARSVTALTFTYVGYETIDVKISPDMKVQMKSSATELSEVVVTGMTAMDKRLFTGATDRLRSEDIKIDGMPEITRALEGRSAGVSIQNVSGTFGAAPVIRVRGATSIYGDSKPLWVVDGVIMEDAINVSADDLSSGNANTLISSAIAGINAEDIADIQILKDGSATSVYGARAMGGVIVITTKRGVPGQHSINYTGEFSIRVKPMYRDFNIMDSQQQMGIYREMESKGWLSFAQSFRSADSGIYGKMYQLMNTYNPATGTFMLDHSQEAANAYLRQAEMRNTNWFDELFQNSVMHNHTISISTGSEKSTIYASLGAMLDPGWYKQSNVKRYTANINATHKVLHNLSFKIGAMGQYRNQKAPGTISSDVNAVTGQVKRDFDINPYSYALNTSRALDANEFYQSNYAPFNIIHELENNRMEYDVSTLKLQAEITYSPISNLTLRGLGAFKYDLTTRDHHIYDDSNQAKSYRAMDDPTIQKTNPLLYKNPDYPYELPVTILPNGGIWYRNDNKMIGYDMRLSADWNQTINDVHIINAFASMELNSANRSEANFTGWGMQYSMGEIPFYVYEYFKQGIEQGSSYYGMVNGRTRNAAYVAQGTYSYLGKYVLSGTVRYEGSNRLGRSKSARWLPTWNIGLGWNIYEEEFFKKWQPAVSHLQIKGSYSMTGDLPPGSMSSSEIEIGAYNPYRPFTDIRETGLRINYLANTELTYEKKHELSLNLQAGFVNNRINLDFSWYDRNNYDLIGYVNSWGVGGEIMKRANDAEMSTWGIEATLKTKNIQTKDFSWTTDFIFSHSKTKITKLITSGTRVFSLVRGVAPLEGYPQRGIFSVPFVGLNEVGLPIFLDENGKETTTGINLQMSDPDKLGYLKYEGPKEPTTHGGFQNTFRYKNFSFGIFFTYSFGNIIRLNPVFRARYTDLTATPKEFKNRWIIPGDEEYTDIPVILSSRQYSKYNNMTNAYSTYNYSSARVAKGDFIRLKDISLNYDVPKAWLGPHVKNASLRFLATNLFLLYADKKLNGQDPEFVQSGGVAAPVPRQFTMSVRLGF
ncbi:MULTISPECIES: SusC/RagA family TonB-linked outer membrane protein [unclassified Dysgonomonas]|uniref:SusC/RagA family TonB-linked outer membrane protein n=1 Tax=unclassified Dysgonomonas TaxID=2630389 RepID=UPI0024746B6C|nr:MULTISPECIES: SusC/RagA family TonB-linked outer membrane protein [unclassified Dysgonomonas]MDL2302952.1 SusC/RagA family TonB-linked outer membrane protein [Dysgonomonas sp. OttesenSCG-928-D17]